MQRSKKYLYSMTSSAREEARARTRIFSVGDRPPILASPISRRRDPDILMPIQPRVCGLLPQILWHRRLGGLRGGPGNIHIPQDILIDSIRLVGMRNSSTDKDTVVFDRCFAHPEVPGRTTGL